MCTETGGTHGHKKERLHGNQCSSGNAHDRPTMDYSQKKLSWEKSSSFEFLVCKLLYPWLLQCISKQKLLLNSFLKDHNFRKRTASDKRPEVKTIIKTSERPSFVLK